MESSEAALSSFYSELQKFEKNNDYERALNVCEKLLEQFPQEKEALHCKIVCLLQLSKFKEACAELDHAKVPLESLAFERAYCLYRLNEPKKALEIISACQNPSQKLLELKAQVLYRLERYEECYQTYREIIKQSHDDYEDERLSNLLAVVASLAATQQLNKSETPQQAEHTYELLYNTACRLAAEGLYIEAKVKLQAAEKLCRSSLEEDGLTEDEILDELAIIKTQIGYCLQKLGKEKEAQAIYNSILKLKPKDVSVIATASNNSVVINRDQNVFDSKKKIRSCTMEILEHKLPSRQRGAIAFNQCLFALYNQQFDYCLQLCDKLQTNFPLMSEGAVLIKSIVLAKDDKVGEAVKLLKKFTTEKVDDQLKLKLTAVQLLLSQNDKDSAAQLLESLVKFNYRPGIVSALVTLYLSKNEHDKATKLLNTAVDWHTNNKNSGVNLKSFWRLAADFYLREGNPQAAISCLHQLLDVNPNNKETIAKLVIAYANFDVRKAAEYCEKLPPLKMDNVDVTALESISWNTSKQKKSKVLPSPGKSSGNDFVEKVGKKKKRKPRLPKVYDPNIPPDPERWLPKHERSNYKKRKDRRYRDTGIGKGTQGAASGSSDQYDITKRTPTSGQNQVQQHGPRLQQRKLPHKKKKKGGR
ncbi:hypothetical protein V9T40_005351 [Parthenolecanium corni]|uniref:Signal recognition particle subunit SRP72 n=1 Tax=Parthenolecanium corni TaxID=536013 RepID=A0AAN9TSU1_9HEMI